MIPENPGSTSLAGPTQAQRQGEAPSDIKIGSQPQPQLQALPPTSSTVPVTSLKTSAMLIPASLPPPTSAPLAPKMSSVLADDPAAPPSQFQLVQQEPCAFTSPVSNTFYSRSDLDSWARGHINSDGDTVYFKPGFVSEDPWARAKEVLAATAARTQSSTPNQART